MDEELREKIREILNTADWTNSEEQPWTANDLIMQLIQQHTAQARLDELIRTPLLRWNEGQSYYYERIAELKAESGEG